MLRKIYADYLLEYPRVVLLLLVLLIAVLGYQARKLEIDASAETLILEDDQDLKLTREVDERYGGQDFLVVTYTPKNNRDLLAEVTLDQIRRLKKDLLQLKSVDSINSILDVPLLASPPKPINELLEDIPTLESPGLDRELARNEFLTSPLYQELLISRDFKTTVLQVILQEDEMYNTLLKRRNDLRQKEKEGTITREEKTELAQVLVDFKQHRDQARIDQHETILQVRAVMDKYRAEADIFLGGISMIADDMVTFLRKDLQIFGLGVLVFLIGTLMFIFRQLRWILLPIFCCSFSVVATAGFLGMFGWEVTVISSNFVSIQIIITMAITIHLIVRLRELTLKSPKNTPHRELILESVVSMAKPCSFAILTTIAGFASLILSGILPVINFGWMMSVGIGVSLLLTFLIFPAVLMFLDRIQPNTWFETRFALPQAFANYTKNNGKQILFGSVAILLFSITGSAQLIVENSFIDYFKDSTEIYKGMVVIDNQLGGTTPLDIILDFKKEEVTVVATADDETDDELDEFEAEFEESENEAQYWFTEDKMQRIEKVHDYLDNLPEVGKVLSLATLLKVGKIINEGEPFDNFMLGLIYTELPEEYRDVVLNPYISIENNQARISVRIIDSDPDLRRNEFLQKVQQDLETQLKLNKDEFQLTSLLVLYNNMLQSLFDSQILTLGSVLLVLMLMFLILFRSLVIAVIAIFPNILSVGFVLGFMGWVGIPLDLMTITIAAISVGIAVDDTIHYIHRFIEEFKKDRNYVATMQRCHQSIGYAMYYTSITIIIGFSILVFSNFIPSIYFGLLTGLAMLIALIASLTLLPQLLIILKPLGPEGSVK